MENKNHYDLIGDIHGCADHLKDLLHKLGYKKNNDYYSHPEGRKVIFLGDFIDRGPLIRKTLGIVKAMVDNKTAEAVMGNHEYNAICFWEKNINKGGYLRSHKPKNIIQHYKTIKEFESHVGEWEMYLHWFTSLPLFIEKENLRIVHACWDPKSIAYLKEQLPGHRLNRSFIHHSSSKGSKQHKAIEVTLKGWEIELPEPHTIEDKEGKTRKASRIRWWLNHAEICYKDYLMSECKSLFNEKVPDELKPTNDYYGDETPVFVGHYWLNGEPELLNERVACLDYSVAKEGELIAYRWDGEKSLSNEKFVSTTKLADLKI
jgi:Calcineurin-like phosphoesterase